MRVTLIMPPTVDPLTAADVKARLGYGAEVSDTLASALVAAARQQLDGYGGWLGRALNTQTWQMTLPGFYDGKRDRYWFDNRNSLTTNDSKLRIPVPPLQSITSITYVDSNGATQTLASNAYRIIRGSTFATIVPIYGTNWPATQVQEDAVTITFIAGYGSQPTDVPEPIRTAITLQVSHLKALTAQNIFISLDRVEGVGEQRFIVGKGSTDVISAAVLSLTENYRVSR